MMNNTPTKTKSNSALEAYQAMTDPDTRWSYAFITEPRPMNNGELVYSMTLLIPKAKTQVIARLRAAIRAAYERSLDKLKGKDATPPALETLPNLIRDGDLEYPGDPSYAGCWFIRAKSTRRPDIRDRANNPIVDPSEVYSGCYGPVLLEFYGYNHITRGIGCSLAAVWKFADGERLGRSVDVNGAFAMIEGAADETNDFLR